MAVLQALNRAGGPFNEEDEQLLGIFTAQAGVALQNALLFRRSERASDRVRSVLELVRNLQNDLNVNSLMFTITQVLSRAAAHPTRSAVTHRLAHTLSRSLSARPLSRRRGPLHPVPRRPPVARAHLTAGTWRRTRPPESEARAKALTHTPSPRFPPRRVRSTFGFLSTRALPGQSQPPASCSM